jgi:bifunctional ADP-heptose synthase (sugar kinase/adenylyltransferase)
VDQEKPPRVLVIGDIMLDHYTYVRTDRNAEEAEIPVWDEIRNEYRLGGAANVANNLRAIAGDELDIHLAGIMGSSVGHHLLRKVGIGTERLYGNATMTKRRYVSEDFTFIGRFDNMKVFPQDEIDFFEMMLSYWDERFDCVIISDYNKGSITAQLAAEMRKCPLTIVDSKRADLSIFGGSTILKVNRREFAAQVSSPLYPDVTRFFKNCVITKGADGADLLTSEIPARDHEVYGEQSRSTVSVERYVVHREEFPLDKKVQARDVTGCGDTHTAALAFALLKTQDLRSAVKFANSCASQVVQKFGTAVALSTDGNV